MLFKNLFQPKIYIRGDGFGDIVKITPCNQEPKKLSLQNEYCLNCIELKREHKKEC